MIKIDIRSERYNFSMTLNQKITVIRGDSGKGKSKLTKAIESASKAYKIKVSDERYTLVVPPSYRDEWFKSISRDIEHADKRIYVIDDADYVFDKRFYELFNKDKNSFYVIINRFTRFETKSLGGLSFCIDEVYSFVANGKNHYLKPYYEFDDNNEIITETNTPNRIEHILTEDSNSGFEFFSTLNKKTKSACGRDNICDVLKGFSGNVLLLADRAALGSCFDRIMQMAKLGKIGIAIPKHYYCFEYLILRSNWFRYNTDSISNDTLCTYGSAEQMYTDILEEITKNKPYKYDKENLSLCYTEDCCNMHGRKQSTAGCDKGIMDKGKIKQLFIKTEFEKLITLIPLI